MISHSRSFLRSLLALALQAAVILQLLALPAAQAGAAGGWMEICTAEGMVKLPVGANGEPTDQAPANHGHDMCDLCLPATATAPAGEPVVVSRPTEYRAASIAFASEKGETPRSIGPPIGPLGPPNRS